MKFFKQLLIGLTLFSMHGLFATSVFAQTSKGGVVRDGDVIYLSTEVNNETTTSTISATPSSYPVHIPQGFATDISSLINGLLSFVMIICALLVFFYLIWGAIQWIVSGGDKGKVTAARQKIISAIVGLIIVAASFAIANLVINFLGFSSFNDVFTNVKTIDGTTTNIE